MFRCVWLNRHSEYYESKIFTQSPSECIQYECESVSDLYTKKYLPKRNQVHVHENLNKIQWG